MNKNISNSSNEEIKLIDQAIESAKCRIYRLRATSGDSCTESHQMKAKNQEALMDITIKALEFYKNHK